MKLSREEYKVEYLEENKPCIVVDHDDDITTEEVRNIIDEYLAKWA